MAAQRELQAIQHGVAAQQRPVEVEQGGRLSGEERGDGFAAQRDGTLGTGAPADGTTGRDSSTVRPGPFGMSSLCWLCGSARQREFMPSTLGREATSEDMKISDSHYGRTARLVECLECGFRYADPLPADDLVALYEDLVDPEYREGSEGRIRPLRRIVARCRTLHPAARTLLDVGAGVGLLCRAALEQGMEATGVEPSAWAVNAARERGMSLLQGTFPHPSLAGRRFDVITSIDVIEHLADPRSLLASIAEALQPGGIAAITTPNVRSLAARLFGRRWWHFRVAHVGYFDPATMRRALHGVGLDLIRQEAYVWSFSVGYLAERLGRYLPVGAAVRAVGRTSPGAALYRVTVPVNLGDSVTYYARKRADPGRA